MSIVVPIAPENEKGILLLKKLPDQMHPWNCGANSTTITTQFMIPLGDY
jgi:hypothetical protein